MDNCAVMLLAGNSQNSLLVQQDGVKSHKGRTAVATKKTFEKDCDHNDNLSCLSSLAFS
jgi:hypothetical protein